jgi:hypothetical protein
MKNKTNIRGQTALILILLSAAALIFFAITVNWGHIAQTKSLVTISADQAASMMASNAASYGEMQKQQYLNNRNRKTELDWMIIIAVIVIIICIIITITSWGAGTPALIAAIGLTIQAVLVIAVVMAVVSLILQLAVIQPGMVTMWNKLQKDQPSQQQFYEQGMGTALMNVVTDQVMITDYFDENSNASFGMSNDLPNDKVSRFGFFYTDRLKMLNAGISPQLKFFYHQLGEVVNGESCYQNYQDHKNYPSTVDINPSCIDPTTGGDYCGKVSPSDPNGDPQDPACQIKIPDEIT